MTVLKSRDLDEFVRRSDELGGPGAAACDAWWRTVDYAPGTIVNDSLNPFGEAFVGRQVALYEEISGRGFDQDHERSTIDVDRHAAAPNPYDHPSPGGLAEHLQRLARALHSATPPLGGRLLDMGCGWGLSSEIAAYCGLQVTAVDISPDFVRLVEKRALERGLAIVARQGTFETYSDDRQFDAVLFYECLHHALRMWTVIDRLAQMLTFDGKIILAGEPINDIWWKNWGMRLDPLSLYCIRKFGWFESGWSLDFVRQAFSRCGLRVAVEESATTGYTIVADHADQRILRPPELQAGCNPLGWYLGVWSH